MNLSVGANIEKRRIALTSVIAAVFLTSFKLVIGITTGSLGILSEALHSALDLTAAIITMLAVKFSGYPADADHNYGHGKIENFSALVETFLLLITSGWIIYEAVHRIISKNVQIEITVWSFVVIITSIIIDVSRSRALYRVARKYNSQALEADALHFSTDIWSSAVVLVGLTGAAFKFYYADTIAALIVALIVLCISYRLGKKAFDVLIDKAPKDTIELVQMIMKDIPEIKGYHDLRVREAGAQKYIELNIHVDKNLTIDQAHAISHKVEEAITKKSSDITVMVHAEPEE